jgi:hypothetical protein
MGTKNKKNNGETVYFPIRSFGDFIIGASLVKFNFKTPIPIVLPEYMLDLFNAIDGSKYFELKGIIKLNTQPAIFELYKLKDVNQFNRLYIETNKIKLGLDKSTNYLLDCRSRRAFFIHAGFIWPAAKKNNYLEKYHLFKEYFDLTSDAVFSRIRLSNKKKRSITIFPESRVPAKEIHPVIINRIIDSFPGIKINIARFSKNGMNEGNTIYYSDFNTLIMYINESDFVISSESLPYHLANFYDKEHFVIYNKTRHFNNKFMTDFIEKYQYFNISDPYKPEATIEKLATII